MLPKKFRIHSRGGFTYIYSNGVRIKGAYGALSAVLPKEGGEGVFRFGFSIPKKVGGAVERNLTKRRLTSIADEWIKEVQQRNYKSFNSVYYSYKYPENFDDLKTDFKKMCEEAVKKLRI